jgi:curved DNA-binding protein CbpA
MDFYEELGLSPRASDAEIRRSYKRLTVLLHPDQHRTPELQVLAEAQMKRINEMVTILTDPEKRRVYDESIRQTPVIVRQIQLEPVHWLRNNRGWLLVVVALLIFVVCAWLIPMLDDGRSVTRAVANPVSPLQAKPLSPSTPAAPADRASAASNAERHRSDTQLRNIQRPLLSAISAPALAASVERSSPKAAVTDTPATQSDTATQSIASLSPAANLNDPGFPRALATLEGRWIYAPDPKDVGDAKLYPAVYVELSISSVGGELRGVYKSKYKVPDPALCPLVNFRFDGSRSETSFPWRGDAGAKGEIMLRLESRDTLKIHWFATEMGSALSLGSGSATLYRF